LAGAVLGFPLENGPNIPAGFAGLKLPKNSGISEKYLATQQRLRVFS
jgi:hypothetical protein